MKTGSRADGFTLVEVMVALAVVAVALPALMFSLHQQIDGTAYLRDKSFAVMVATNQLNEIRLLARARQQLEKGSDSGSAELAGRQWQWRVNTTETVVPNFYRIEIDVSEMDAPDDAVLYTLVGSLSGDFANPATGPGAAGGTQNAGGTGDGTGDGTGTTTPGVTPGAGATGEP